MDIIELFDRETRTKVVVEPKRREGSQLVATCPKCEDPSEHLYLDVAKRVYYCQKCEWAGPFWNPKYESPPKKTPPRRIAKTYDYSDADGTFLFQVVKYSSGKPRFRQRRRDKNGNWVWNTKGVRRVLYRLLELIRSSGLIFVPEGEKDVDNICALDLTATTSPMGAGKWHLMKGGCNKYFAGWKVVLIPDPDEEGEKHIHEIGMEISGIAETIQILRLRGKGGEGLDFSDWKKEGGTKEELLKLAEEAPEFVPEPETFKAQFPRAVFEKGGMYQKTKTIRNEVYEYPITNFVIIPKMRVLADEGEFLRARIKTHRGEVHSNIQFASESWISKPKFKRALKGLLDLEYKGTDDDIQDIMGILADQKPPFKLGVPKIGLHRFEKKWVYVEEKLAWDKDGEQNGIVYLTEDPYRANLLGEPTLTSGQLDEILASLFDFNAIDVVYPLLGFCFACFVKERIFPITEQNPILICWGEKGSGKSMTLVVVIQRLFGIRTAKEDIGLPTKFSFAKVLSSSNLTPVLYDEYKTHKIDLAQQKVISGMMTAIYNQERITRGTSTLGLREFIYSAPTVIAGEMKTQELAIQDRIIETYFSKKKIEGKGRLEAFEKLSELPLGALGKDFLFWTLKLEDEEIKEMRELQKETVNEKLTGRLRDNTAHARLGLALFLRYLNEKGKDTKRFHDGFDIIDQAQITNVLEQSTKSIVDTTIEAFSIMAGEKTLLKEGVHYKIDFDFNLNLHVSSIYPLFKKWARDTAWDGEVLNKNSFTKQLREAKYFRRYDSVRLGNKTRSVFILDLSLMKHLDAEEFTETLPEAD